MEKFYDSKKNNQEIPAQCKECGNVSRPVKRITLKHLLKEEKLSFVRDVQYFFCSAPNCEVVYFSENGDIFYKTDLKIRVGIKETEEPIPVCYCFGYTKKMILDDFRQNGRSTTKDKISEGIKAAKCRCSITNPQGVCCLGNIARIIEETIMAK